MILEMLAAGAVVLAAASDRDMTDRERIYWMLGKIEHLARLGREDLVIAWVLQRMRSVPRHHWPYGTPDQRHAAQKSTYWELKHILRSISEYFPGVTYDLMESGLKRAVVKDGDVELTHYWPAPGFVVEPRETIWVFTLSDGYVVSVSDDPDASRPRFWGHPLSEEPIFSIERFDDIPAGIARALLDNEEQALYGDGHEMAGELSFFDRVTVYERNEPDERDRFP
jgi:hypothetical protein